MNNQFEQLVRVQLKAVYLHPKHNVPTLFLTDDKGSVVLSMVIGFLEAQSILIGWQKLPVPRPLTADLIRLLIEQDFTSRVERVVISDVRDGAFIATIVIQRGEQVIERDCRPSDALSLAVRANAPIYLTQSVVEKTEKEQENTWALMAYLEAENQDIQDILQA